MRSSEDVRAHARAAAEAVPRHRRIRRASLELAPAEAGPAPAGAARPGAVEPVRSSRVLRGALFGLDALAVALGWATALLIGGVSLAGRSGRHGAVELLVVVAVTLLAIGWQGLYLARVCSVRTVETVRLGRAVAVGTVVALIASPRVGGAVEGRDAIAAAIVTFVLLATFRAAYTTWLRRVRAAGRFSRPVVVIGTGHEGYELFRLLELHPELGFRVEGVVGPEAPYRAWQVGAPWLGDVSEAAALTLASGATGALVAASDLSSDDLNRVTRGLLERGVHVHLSSGLRGIDSRRLRALPLAHEPLFYLEPMTLSRWQLVVKRLLDLVLSTLLLVLFSPILVVAAIAVKLQDGGPLLFRQRRVGRNGEDFTLLKLRTMVPDAEQRLLEVSEANEREGGPLFKLEKDPRRTRVGHLLERTSIDELPQLVNVLRGEMSLVGPRPALRVEVDQFDGELLGRLRVLPGITGLWQVEGRENPAFDVYRRLDLFYVENWSVGLDLAIMLGTVRSIAARLLWRGKSTAPGPVAVEPA